MCLCSLYVQIDEQIETLFASKKRVTDVAKANMPIVGAGMYPSFIAMNLFLVADLMNQRWCKSKDSCGNHLLFYFSSICQPKKR